jgi:hypothetical protein
LSLSGDSALSSKPGNVSREEMESEEEFPPPGEGVRPRGE